MICESCKFNNRDGALFCAECGKPLASANANSGKPMPKDDNDKTVLLDEVVTNSKESVDDSEASTTVLTSDMLKPAQPVQPAKPQGFTTAPTPVKPMAPQAVPMNGQPVPQAPKMAPQAVPMNGQPAPQAPKMAPQVAPMNGQPTPQAPKMAPQAAPMNGQPAPQAPKMAPQAAPMNGQPSAPVAKEDKKADKTSKKADKGKMGTGTKVYIVISIILMLAMAGALVFGYFYHTKKVDEKNKSIDELTASASDAKADAEQKGTQITQLNADLTAANAQVEALTVQNASSLDALEVAEETASKYTSYNSLIGFVESETANASTEMMVSDTVIYTTVGSEVLVYVYFPSQTGGELNYLVSDINVADCTWGEDWVNGNVLPIYVSAKGAGDATITVTNDQNDITEKIFVHVE